MASAEGKETRLAAVSVAALGVVYGDIGTSPLYTLNTIFAGSQHSVPLTPGNVLGILSLIFWSLLIVVTLKYVYFILRADNHGEGGIMALMALVLHKSDGRLKHPGLIISLGLIGAALFYGDGVITPAISVISAVEGLEVAAPAFKPFVIPVTVAILIGLFAAERRGTASIGRLFGPIMLGWFVVLALLGIMNIAAAPGVLKALNPLQALLFLASDPALGFFSLGGVVLALTGAEALYADMGHFGRNPIRAAWIGLVMPALVLNYFGQGALLLTDAKAIENPFYLLAPGWALYPLIVLSTTATIIASQAVISGAYSITQQAMQLGYSPRMQIHHTSGRQIGQIYIPAINWSLMIAVIALVIGFGSSANLGAAYGIAVTGTMLITNLLAFYAAQYLWQWNPWRAFFGVSVFVLIDLTFFLANTVKIAEGGWFPLAFALVVFLLLTTWKQGRQLFAERIATDALDLRSFANDFSKTGSVVRVPGTAVFLTPNLKHVPNELLHSLKHYKALHERVVFATVSVQGIPRVPDERRVHVEALPNNFWLLRITFGFMDDLDVPKALEQCEKQGLAFDIMATSFFIGRATLFAKKGSEMPFWREKLFIAMFRNSSGAGNFFKLPPSQVIELGAQVPL
jgi:KUP system potassium uptake protein